MEKIGDSAKLRIKNINAWYRDTQVLHNINLDIYENKVTVIMGPSGCGKTTLLRTINRLHETFPGSKVEGEIYLDDINIYNKNVNPVEIRRRIGMIFQLPIAFPHLSIYDNVAIGLKLNSVKDKEILNNIVEKSLREAGLWDEVEGRLKEKGVILSGGQKQRLSIARALALKPEVLLMDEPTSALDPIATSKIEELISRLKNEYTIILVTHNVQQAARVADYIAFLYNGRVVEYDRAEELLERPKKKLTEKYILGEF